MIETGYRNALAFVVEPRFPGGCTIKFVSDGKLVEASHSEVTPDKAVPI